MQLSKLFHLRGMALRSEGVSPKTLEQLRLTEKRFIAFLSAQGEVPSAQELTSADLRAFVLHLADENLAPETQAYYVRPVRALFRWAYLEGLLPTNIAERVKAPKVPKKVIPSLSEEAVVGLLEAAKRSRNSLRDQAIVMLLFDCGLRAGELTGLDLVDVNWDFQQLRVQGKGDKERVVPIGYHTFRALRKYVAQERSKLPGANLSPALFMSERGTRYTYEGLHQMLDRLAAKAGIGRVRPHVLRHTFARAYLRNGGDVFSLQKILGHSSLEMTRRYAELSVEDVKRAHQRSSPTDRLKGR